ncbi:MAG: hypothetical protein HKN15_00300 [Xanthomonadales bacterium]|nr:hypothetical protein [Xanthomonadales bacterium]
MIRLKPRRRIRIPHLFAGLAALLLVAVSWVGGPADSAPGNEPAQASAPSLAQGGDHDSAEPGPRKRKLSISLLLLGRG